MPNLEPTADPEKSEQYEKYSDTEMKVTTPVQDTKEEIISYDRIVNDIRELSARLDRLNVLKAEADKLGITK